MGGKVAKHPYHDLMAEAAREREVSDSAEAQVLQEAIFSAVRAYSDFLDRHGLIYDHDEYPDCMPRLKAQALVVTVDYGLDPGTVDISLKDGACDRVYGNGVDPDPDGRGPPAIPHKQRP
jgi:hypothetical protein